MLHDQPFAGIERATCSTERTTLVRYRFEPGATFPLHSHPEEQLTVVLEGSAREVADDVGHLHDLYFGV